MPALLWCAVGGVILTVGDILFKFWVERPSPLLYVSGLALYLLGAVFLVQSYKSENIAVATVIFIVFNVVTLSIVSWLYFGERLSALQIGAVVLALGAIALLELGK